MKKLIILIIIYLSLFGCLSYKKISGYFKYEISENGAIIVDYKGKENILTLPEILDGYNVIGLKSLYSGEYIYSIKIPSSIKWIAPDAFSRCSHLEKITFLDDADKISGIDELQKSTRTYYSVLLEYNVPRKIEKVLYNKNNNRIILLTELLQWRKGQYNVKTVETYSIKFNENIVYTTEEKEPNLEIIRIDHDSIIYKISLEYGPTVLMNNENRISKEYSKIYDIKYGTSSNIYYIGNGEFCRNLEVLGKPQFLNLSGRNINGMQIKEYCISKDGLQFAYVQVYITGNRRNKPLFASDIFLNGELYYRSPLERSIVIEDYLAFHPNEKSLIYIIHDGTIDDKLYYYLRISSNTYGPYAYIDKKSCKISDDLQYFIFQCNETSLYDKSIEKKIKL